MVKTKGVMFFVESFSKVVWTLGCMARPLRILYPDADYVMNRGVGPVDRWEPSRPKTDASRPEARR